MTLSPSLRGPGRAVRLENGRELHALDSARTTTVLLPGASSGGPERLAGAVLDVLLEVERRGLHTVLIAAAPPDLHTQVAAVSRYVAACDAEVLAEARAIWGADRVLAAAGLADRDLARPLAALPVPASRTWQRRLLARAGILRAALAWIRQNRPGR